MAKTFVYEIGENLYLNITNKCSNNCDFCVRNGKDSYFGNKLWLDYEPTSQEVLSQIDYTKKYNEVVFCGFGEPTERVETLIEIASALKEKGYTIRLNTNGQGNLINGRDVTKELAKVLDYVNVSLNQSDKVKYQNLCHSVYGEEAFDELIDFAKRCRDNGIKTTLSVVDCIGEEEVKKCKELAKNNALDLRVRAYIQES